MQCILANKLVVNIIGSKDNIIDQIKELKVHFYNKGVRQYIDRLIYANSSSDNVSQESKYILYCIIKYFYGLDVSEIKVPLPKLPMASYDDKFHYDADKLNALLDEKDNIIEQCKLLREHKNMKGLNEYINNVLENYDYDITLANISRDFEIFCINKYFYGLDVSEVEPRAFDLRPYTYVFRKKVKEYIPEHFTDFKEIKKGDKVKILNGPFNNMIGYIYDINNESLKLTIMIDFSGIKTPIELDYNSDKVIKVDDNYE